MLRVCIKYWMLIFQHRLAGPQPVAFGSLEMDGTEGDDVNGVTAYCTLTLYLRFAPTATHLPTCHQCLQMLASIFRQLGGQGHVAGFMAGDNGHASGTTIERALSFVTALVLLLTLLLLASLLHWAHVDTTDLLCFCRGRQTAEAGARSTVHCSAGTATH